MADPPIDAATLRNTPYNSTRGVRAQAGLMRRTFRNWIRLSALRKLASLTGWRWVLDRPLRIETRAGDRLEARCRDMDGAIDVFGEGAYDLNFLDWGSVATVLDVGAQIGDFTVWVARRAPCRVYAVEPNPETYAFLERNVRAAGLQARVRLEAVALAGRPGRRRLQLAPISSSSALGEVGIEVEAVDLAGLVRRSGFEAIDLLKVDIEGAEYEVFAEVPDEVFRQVRSLIVECHPHPAADRQALRSRFRQLGYRVAEEQFLRQGTLMAWR